MEERNMQSPLFVFRDIVTQPDETISLHQEKIDHYGYCWWGWWKKVIEDVPTALFDEIMRQPSPRYGLLFDCGQYRIYATEIAGISIAPSDEGMQSPNLSCTPTYYVHLSSIVVWLKLKSFKPIRNSAALCAEMRYASFPTWRIPKYGKFIGETVSSLEELDSMLPTLWTVEWDGSEAIDKIDNIV
jgi:hypothetical protein